MCHLLGSDQRVALKIFWWGCSSCPMREGQPRGQYFAFHFISRHWIQGKVREGKGREGRLFSVRAEKGGVGKSVTYLTEGKEHASRGNDGVQAKQNKTDRNRIVPMQRNAMQPTKNEGIISFNIILVVMTVLEPYPGRGVYVTRVKKN
jgi:adenosylcobinamide amidohydrolase